MSGSTDTGGGVDGSSGAAGGGGVEGRNGDSAAAAAAAAVLGVVLGPALLSGSSMSRIAASWTGCVGACSKEKTTLDSKALPANIAKSKEEMEEGMYIQKDGWWEIATGVAIIRPLHQSQKCVCGEPTTLATADSVCILTTVL